MRILIATYGSPHDKVALHLGAHVAQRSGEPPTILAVIDHCDDRPMPGGDLILTRWREISNLTDLEARTEIRLGQPSEEIIRETKADAYGLLIVGDGQRARPLARFLHSPTAVQVVKCAPCSVLVTKGQARPIRQVLLCDSGAENPSTRACSKAGPLAVLRTSISGQSLLNRFTTQFASLLADEEEVTVLHVMSQMGAGPGVIGTQLRADAEELMRQHAPEGELLEQDGRALTLPGIHPHLAVRHGLVVDEILAEARDGDYDLVVIGAHSREWWQRILLDDLAREILIKLDRSLLVVR
jgi:nucleotide-binding universal stress UspA family protein